MTLKEFIEHFHQYLNFTQYIIIEMEETIQIIKEKHNTDINKSIEMI